MQSLQGMREVPGCWAEMVTVLLAKMPTHRLPVFSGVPFVSWAPGGAGWSTISHSPVRAGVPTKTRGPLLPGLPEGPRRPWSSLWTERKQEGRGGPGGRGQRSASGAFPASRPFSCQMLRHSFPRRKWTWLADSSPGVIVQG